MEPGMFDGLFIFLITVGIIIGLAIGGVGHCVSKHYKIIKIEEPK